MFADKPTQVCARIGGLPIYFQFMWYIGISMCIVYTYIYSGKLNGENDDLNSSKL